MAQASKQAAAQKISLRIKGKESSDDSSDQVIDLLKHKVKLSCRTTELAAVAAAWNLACRS